MNGAPLVLTVGQDIAIVNQSLHQSFNQHESTVLIVWRCKDSSVTFCPFYITQCCTCIPECDSPKLSPGRTGFIRSCQLQSLSFHRKSRKSRNTLTLSPVLKAIAQVVRPRVDALDSRGICWWGIVHITWVGARAGLVGGHVWVRAIWGIRKTVCVHLCRSAVLEARVEAGVDAWRTDHGSDVFTNTVTWNDKNIGLLLL